MATWLKPYTLAYWSKASTTMKQPAPTELSAMKGVARMYPVITLSALTAVMKVDPTHTDPNEVVVARFSARSPGTGIVLPKYLQSGSREPSANVGWFLCIVAV